ncbi:CDGP domain-containing protein [Mycobacterium bourgelatii]|nr:hypothetical protein [Mycobacterium bourgelatii]MCV6973909.1 hypothetical protein [Mycobacterium bourgelatii]
MAGGLVAFAPPASAGCQYGGIFISKCDGPIEPDGTWQRCVVYSGVSTVPNYRPHETHCEQMGPDLHPWGLAFNDPPTRIDD